MIAAGKIGTDVNLEAKLPDGSEPFDHLERMNTDDNVTQLGIARDNNKTQLDIAKDGTNTQLMAAGIGQLGQVFNSLFQWLGFKEYQETQEEVARINSAGAVEIAQEATKWKGLETKVMNHQNDLLLGPGGYLRERDRTRAQAAENITRVHEDGRTDRAALSRADGAFEMDFRDNYDYGRPFGSDERNG